MKITKMTVESLEYGLSSVNTFFKGANTGLTMANTKLEEWNLDVTRKYNIKKEKNAIKTQAFEENKANILEFYKKKEVLKLQKKYGLLVEGSKTEQ